MESIRGITFEAHKLTSADFSMMLYITTTSFASIIYLMETPELCAIERALALDDQNWHEKDKKNFNLGFVKDSYWLKIDIPSCSTADEHVQGRFLKIGYPLLDEIKVWFYDNENHLKKFYEVGDTKPFDQRPVHRLSFFLPLKWDFAKVYLRIQTTSTMHVPLEFVDDNNYVERDAVASEVYQMHLFQRVDIRLHRDSSDLLGE